MISRNVNHEKKKKHFKLSTNLSLVSLKLTPHTTHVFVVRVLNNERTCFIIIKKTLNGGDQKNTALALARFVSGGGSIKNYSAQFSRP